MNSIWTATAENKGFPALQGDIKTDVVIVGGGLAGVLCLKELSSRGVDCVLLEAKSIGSGITKNTTAKITFQHGLFYHKLLDKKGKETAQGYLLSNKLAFEKLCRLCSSMRCS